MVELSAVRSAHFRDDPEFARDRVVAAAVEAANGVDGERAQEGLRVLGLARERIDLVLAQSASLDPRRRAAAVTALGSFDPEIDDVINTLAEALADENSYVAVAALQVVSKLQLDTFAREVRDLCDDEVLPVQLSALRALGRVSDGRDDDVQIVRRCLRSTNRKVRQAACVAARGLAHPDLVNDLCEVLLEWSKDRNVKVSQMRAALTAVAACGATEAALQLMFELLQRPTVRTYTANALEFVGDARAIAPLRHLLDDPSDALRASAASALAAIEGGMDEDTLRRCWDIDDATRSAAIRWLTSQGSLDASWNGRLRDEALGGTARTRPAALKAYLESTGDYELAARLVGDTHVGVAAVAADVLAAAGLDPASFTQATEDYTVATWQPIGRSAVQASSPIDAAATVLDELPSGWLVTVTDRTGRLVVTGQAEPEGGPSD